MKYNIFDAKYKIDSVKRFLDLKEHIPFKIGYGSYAKSINVNKATFVAWVKKYQENNLNCYEVNTDDKSLMLINNNDNTDFINLSEDRFEVVNSSDDANTIDVALKNKYSLPNKNMSLKINGGVIEFNPSYLKEVIEVLKSC